MQKRRWREKRSKDSLTPSTDLGILGPERSGKKKKRYDTKQAMEKKIADVNGSDK